MSWSDLVEKRNADMMLLCQNVDPEEGIFTSNGFVFSHNPLGIGPGGDGNESSQLPEEIVEVILSKVGTDDLLTLNKVCRQWKTIVSKNMSFWNHVFKEQGLKLQNVPEHILQEKNVWVVLHAIVKHQILSKNFVRNSCGEEQFTHWTVVRNGGNGVIIEENPVGCTALPEDPNFPGTTSCFVTSYMPGIISQEIDLWEAGINPNVLNLLKPCELKFSVMIGTRGRYDERSFFRGAKGMCRVHFKDDVNTLLTSRYAEVNTRSGSYWQLIEFGMPIILPENCNVRKVGIYLEGCDNNRWAGHFGLKFSRVSLRLNLHVGVENVYHISTESRTDDRDLKITGIHFTSMTDMRI